MTPNEIFASVRMSPKIADNAGMKYSGYQMIDAFNDIMNVVYNTLSTMNSDLLWIAPGGLPYGGIREGCRRQCVDASRKEHGSGKVYVPNRG